MTCGGSPSGLRACSCRTTTLTWTSSRAVPAGGPSAKFTGRSCSAMTCACTAPTAASRTWYAAASRSGSPSARHTAAQYAEAAAGSGPDVTMMRNSSAGSLRPGLSPGLRGRYWRTIQPARPEPCAATRSRQAVRSRASSPAARQIPDQNLWALVTSCSVRDASKVSIRQVSGYARTQSWGWPSLPGLKRVSSRSGKSRMGKRSGHR